MIHPAIETVFVDNDKLKLFFAWLCQRIKKIDELREFIRWHLDVNKEVIREITNTKSVDFSNETEAKKWAEEFLQNYEEKIRRMRRISNLVFEQFYKLKEYEFDRIIEGNKDYEKEITEMMQIFLNKKELLIGKIIFAYRETWFLAKQINDPNFKLGSVKDYQNWVESNFSNLRELNISLEIIHSEISKWKR